MTAPFKVNRDANSGLVVSVSSADGGTTDVNDPTFRAWNAAQTVPDDCLPHPPIPVSGTRTQWQTAIDGLKIPSEFQNLPPAQQAILLFYALKQLRNQL